MPPVLHALAPGYARREMPQPKRGHGPWGEAIQALLNERNLRQADLVKAAKIPPKTISRITRGFDGNTKLLKRIAEALSVPFERVLVPPQRRWPDDARRQLARINEDLARLQQSIESDVTGHDPEREIGARVQALVPDDRRAVLDVLATYERLPKKGQPKKGQPKKDEHARNGSVLPAKGETPIPGKKRKH